MIRQVTVVTYTYMVILYIYTLAVTENTYKGSTATSSSRWNILVYSIHWPYIKRNYTAWKLPLGVAIPAHNNGTPRSSNHHIQYSPDIMNYTHKLLSTLPPSNYSCATMNVINHIYIGILPRSTHVIIQQYICTFVTEQQRAHEQ